MKPVKQAISIAIFQPDGSNLLVVQRPPDDEDLANAWGLPAGSLHENETYEEAVLRSGREKLGVELSVGKLLNEGETERGQYILHMRLYEATVASGKPSVPQPVDGITQYTDWTWADPTRLEPAARQGSLCSQLCLAYTDQPNTNP